MDSPPNIKPKVPPKPASQRPKELITAERYFRENPVISRQKPPLAPKPVLSSPSRRTSSVATSDLVNDDKTPSTDSVSKLIRRSSDLTNRAPDFHRPSLALSPPTPDSEDGGWLLVQDGNQNDSQKLLSEDNSLNESSLHSSSSFLFPLGRSESLNSADSVERSPEESIGGVQTACEHPKSADDNDSSRSRTDSLGNESFDGSTNTVRRRISSFFGSFGKGGKTKEKRESSLFYYSSTGEDTAQMDSSDSNRNSLSDISVTTSCNNNNVEITVDSNRTLKVTANCFNGDSNRSSISDESFDAESSKSNNTSKEENKVPIDPEERKKKCFFIANELMTSEKVFIDVLKLLCHDFKKAVDEAGQQQKSPVIPPNDFNKIINNLPQLLGLNEDLLKDIESRIESWNELPKIADVIVKKGPFLKLYSSYITNFTAQTDFLDECCEKYRKFAQVVRDFEKSERCEKLALKHYMLKPVQRIPQYRLLLEQYLIHQEEGSLDHADTRTALSIVCDVADHANHSIKQGDHLSKLLSIQSQLGDYEIIKPGRHFVKEGELFKLCRKDMQLRFFILLSDCLLYTSYYGSMTGLKVKYKLPLGGMKVSTAHSTDCATEFSIITSTRSFILRAKSRQECEEWVQSLQQAIRDYNSRQMTFLNKQSYPCSVLAEPLKLGREAPVWVQDQRVTMCQICTAEFTMTFRRHHCRACGKVVCSACSDYKAPLQYNHFVANRVCVDCFDYLLKEMDDPAADMAAVVKKELDLADEEVPVKMQEIRSLFKKIGQGFAKKNKKYIPQRLKEVTANDTGSQMSGWLHRRSRTRWKRLWFVLKEQVLYTYKASEDVVAADSTVVLGWTVEEVPQGEYDEVRGEWRVFHLAHPNQPALTFAADPSATDRWLVALREATLLK